MSTTVTPTAPIRKNIDATSTSVSSLLSSRKQSLLCRPQLFQLLLAHLRVMYVQRRQRLDHRGGDVDAGVPLVVAGHHVPWSMLGRRISDRVLICCLVV